MQGKLSPRGVVKEAATGYSSCTMRDGRAEYSSQLSLDDDGNGHGRGDRGA
jgi:hypothetical protein